MSLKADSDEFGTPQAIFDALNARYQFTVDAAASKENTKVPYHFWTKEDDALKQDWAGLRVFCNPPYSRGNCKAFAYKAFRETIKGCEVVVLLVPTKTEQPWFHELLRSGRVDVYFFEGRLTFEGGATTARDSHMFLVIWPPLRFANKKHYGVQS